VGKFFTSFGSLKSMKLMWMVEMPYKWDDILQIKEIELNLYKKNVRFNKSESLFILLNSIESKFIICGMINMKVETLTDVSSFST
jgi:hypothetical protein